MSATGHRPLLPRADQTTNNELASPEAAQVRKHVGLACIACKRRKTKCDGTTPCGMCTRKATECIYEAAQSRMESMRVLNEEYKKKNEQYKTILSYLRSGTVEESQEILARLRNGPSIEAVVEHIEHAALLAPGSTPQQSTENVEKSQFKRKYEEALDKEEDDASASTSATRAQMNSFFDHGVGVGTAMWRREPFSGRLPISSLLSDPVPPTPPYSNTSSRAANWTSATDNDALVMELVST